MKRRHISLEVAYKGLPIYDRDRLIFKIGRLFRGRDGGSGYLFGGSVWGCTNQSSTSGTRDCSITFKSEAQAILAMEAFMSNMPKLVVTLSSYDEETLEGGIITSVKT